MADGERPVHAVYDCAVGEQVEVPFTDAEWAEHKARIVQDGAEREAAAKTDAELRAAVAAHPDPVVHALAARLGLAAAP
jgi:hypothetical protein